MLEGDSFLFVSKIPLLLRRVYLLATRTSKRARSADFDVLLLRSWEEEDFYESMETRFTTKMGGCLFLATDDLRCMTSLMTTNSGTDEIIYDAMDHVCFERWTLDLDTLHGTI